MLKNCGHSMKWKELAVNRMLLVMIKRRGNIRSTQAGLRGLIGVGE
jgi:hypothetical protein